MTRNVLCLIAGLALLCVPAAGAGRIGTAEVLKRKVSKPHISAPMNEAVVKLRKLSGVRIEVDWAALKASGVGPDTNVTLKVTGVTFEQLLDLTLAQVAVRGRPLSWYIDDDVVRITTQRRVLARRELPVRSATSRPSVRPVRVREFNFDNIPLKDVITFFRDAGGVNFFVNWRAMETVGLGRDTPITLKASGISFAKVLDLVTDQISANLSKYDRVYWLVDRGVVHISTGTALDRRLRTRMYNVADLLMVVPNFRGFRMTMEVAGGGRDGGSASGSSMFEDEERSDEKDESPAAQRKRLRENLIGAIKDSIGEDMWQPQGKGSIRLFGKKLIISQTLLGFKLLSEAAGKR